LTSHAVLSRLQVRVNGRFPGMSLCRLPDLLEFAGSCQRKHHEIEWFFRTTVDGRRDTTIGLRDELDDINTTDEEEKVATSGRATLYRNPDRIVDRNGVV